MRVLAPLLTILGCVFLASVPFAHAAATSDWPSLNDDAAQSNYNRVEKTLTAKNFLKLKVRWTAPIADQSYPVVSGDRVYVPVLGKSAVHARALDIATGKTVATYFKDSLGGLLVDASSLYVAGKMLQAIDTASGQVVAQVTAPPGKHGVFVNPVADRKVVVVGFAGSASAPTTLYTVDPSTNTLVHTLPSTSALGTIDINRILTSTVTGGAFYDENTGRKITSQSFVGSHWFAGNGLGYTVASVKGHRAAIYAFDGTGHKVWSRTVGPFLATQGTDWPHAVGENGLYIHMLKPADGIEALDPLSGGVLWRVRIPFVQRLALANDVLYALTYGLNQPVRVVAIAASTGKVLGAIVLSTGYEAFSSPNGLMVANGMIFIRAQGPKGSMLIALGLSQS